MPEKKYLYQSTVDLKSAYSTWWSYFSQYAMRSADQIIVKKGKGRYSYYYEMVDSDGILSGLVENRIDAVAGLDWEVYASDEEEESKERADFVAAALHRIAHFDEDLGEILAACITGFAVTEIVWKDVEIDGVIYLLPDRLAARPCDMFVFGDDGELRLLQTDMTRGDDTRQWPFKFIVHTFRGRDENLYGVSMLRAVYWAWWFKHNAFGYWLRAAEMGAEVTPVFRYDQNASEEEIVAMAEAAKVFLKSHYIVCPMTCTIEFPHISIDPEFASRLIDQCDNEMRFRILGNILASGVAESGTRALGQVHETQEQKRKEHDAKSLAECIKTTVIRWIIDLNFGPDVPAPVFKLKYETDEDIVQVRENIKVAVSHGVPISTNYIASKLNLQVAAEGEPLATAPGPGGTGVMPPF